MGQTVVLCGSHAGLHYEGPGCTYVHEVAAEGATWADGRYGS